MAAASPVRTTSDMTFLSYNPTGMSSDKISWVNDLLNTTKCTFAGIQEHFQSQFSGGRKTIGKAVRVFNEGFPNYKCSVVPAVRGVGVTRGRAAGGLAQLCNKSVDLKCDKVSTSNNRLQCQIIELPSNIKIFWCNVYFPVDTGASRESFDETELVTVLTELENLMDQSSFDHCILGGDLNFEKSRTNNGFIQIVSEFCERLGVESTWDTFSVDFTHIHTDYKSVATLDHFLVNKDLLPFITDCNVMHFGDNLSRHSPIMMRINVGDIPARQRVVPPVSRRSPAWYKAKKDHLNSYTFNLHEKIDTLHVPQSLSCRNPECKSEQHKNERDQYMLDVLSSLC